MRDRSFAYRQRQSQAAKQRNIEYFFSKPQEVNTKPIANYWQRFSASMKTTMLGLWDNPWFWIALMTCTLMVNTVGEMHV